ncbi:MAG: hypothetical protein DME01_16160 [Candidatus Rokuibacteriota bacterium]|nr:MAG: hypothetical protein DME01_16160 [Candidatus Rokubacteria bacterium]
MKRICARPRGNRMLGGAVRRVNAASRDDTESAAALGAPSFGAIGVSGVQSHEDEQIASAGAAALA